MGANPFETGERKAIPAVLVYVRHRDEVLMVHRNAADRPGDYHAGRWNGLGGKLEPDESPLEAARREVREESGLDLPEDVFTALGSVTFPNFKAHKNEDWNVWVFVARASDTHRAAPVRGPEGDLHWVPAAELLGLNLWPGDRHFVPLVLEERPFFATIWYRGPDVARSWVQAR